MKQVSFGSGVKESPICESMDEVNQEESGRNEVDGMKKGADSTGKVMHEQRCH